MKRIAINTGGGDAPGLNAVIRAVVGAALNRGWECFGILDGYSGILEPENYPKGGIVPLTRDSIRGITHLGGTILGTTNKGNPFTYPILQQDGTYKNIDRSDEIIAKLHELQIDALIAIGGDGSLSIAGKLSRKGLQVIGVPKTIDNDLVGTVTTFGFDSAVSFATECIDRLHTTADAHHRVIVVEVMGRDAGWIALNAGISGTADAILIPEIPYDIQKVAEKIRQRDAHGRKFSIVVVAEGAKPLGGTVSTVATEVGRVERLGGIGEKVAGELREITHKDTRSVVLGHLLRGGSPTTFDRLLSLRFGAAAIRALDEGKTNVMVSLVPPSVQYIPIEDVIGKTKTVELDSDVVLTARDLGICLGD